MHQETCGTSVEWQKLTRHLMALSEQSRWPLGLVHCYDQFTNYVCLNPSVHELMNLSEDLQHYYIISVTWSLCLVTPVLFVTWSDECSSYAVSFCLHVDRRYICWELIRGVIWLPFSLVTHNRTWDVIYQNIGILHYTENWYLILTALCDMSIKW